MSAQLLMAEEMFHMQNTVDRGGDIQCDSIPWRNLSDARQMSDLSQNLIDVDEEMGEEDLELLKFACRDHIPVGRLASAQKSLTVFDYLFKQSIITLDNLDFLLECLMRIHRSDLIRKLGFRPEDVRQNLPNLMNPFRVLLLEIGEDIDMDEFNKMKFWMSSHIKKKKLQDQKSVFELFVYMEKENLLSYDNTSELEEVLKAIKRGDLVEQIEQFRGTVRKPVTRSQYTRTTDTPQAPPQYEAQTVIGQRLPEGVCHETANPNPAIRQQMMPVRSGSDTTGQQTMAGGGGGVNMAIAKSPNPPLDRSPSAGTLSVPSEESSETGTDIYTGPLPEPLFLQIANDLKDQFEDLGIVLGYTNDEIVRYVDAYEDVNSRTRKLLMDWQAKKLDKGAIIPGLLYVLEILGCKQTRDALKKHVEMLGKQKAQGQGQQAVHNTGPPAAGQGPGNFRPNIGETSPPAEGFQPVGPPEENHYSSLLSAQPHVRTQQLVRELPVRNEDATNSQPQPTVVPQQNPAPQHTSGVPVVNMSELGQRFTRLLTEQQLPPDQISTQAIQLSRQLQFPQNVEQNTAQNVQGNVTVDQRSGAVGGVNLGQGQAMSNVSEDSAELPEYRMDRRPRGWCIIINNKNFHVQQGDAESKEMPTRNGTDVDAESLQYIFEKLGFIVRRRDNQTDVEMMNYMVEVSHNVDHTNFDAFVCCILTHGVLGHLYGVNGRLVSTRDLTANFQSNRCASLAGKPKLFFLQACQGRDKMGGGVIEKDSPVHTDATGNFQGEEVMTDSANEMIPNESDFLLGYATVPGYVSFRSRHHGSWYIRKLCELLQKLHERHDLMSILVEVNREVSRANANMDGGLYKQTPAPLFTLRKKLFFR